MGPITGNLSRLFLDGEDLHDNETWLENWAKHLTSGKDYDRSRIARWTTVEELFILAHEVLRENKSELVSGSMQQS